MNLGSLVGVLLGHWRVVLLGLVITVGLSVYLYNSTPPSHQATGRILLLLPADAQSRGEVDETGSPFLYLPPGLNVLARVAVSAPDSREFVAEMEAKGLTSEFEVGVDFTEPIISVSVEGQNPDRVLATRDAVLDSIEEELLRVQTEVQTPTRQLAHAKIFATEDTPELMSGSRTRGSLSVVAAGGLVTLVAVLVIDRRFHRPKGRRAKGANNEVEDVSDVDATKADAVAPGDRSR